MKKYSNDRRSSKKNNKKPISKKPKYEKVPENLEDITLDYATFPIKFNIFGKVKYNKKDILKAFGLHYNTKDEHKRFNLYYTDKFIKESAKLFDTLFKDIDKVTKKDYYYMKNCMKTKLPVTFDNDDTILKEVKYQLIKTLANNKLNFYICINVSDIFSVLKLYSGKELYNKYIKQSNPEYRDIYYDFSEHKLKGFIYEKNSMSYGYFVNYKPDIRSYARLMSNKIVKDKYSFNEELSNSIRNMFKRVKIIQFKIGD